MILWEPPWLIVLIATGLECCLSTTCKPFGVPSSDASLSLLWFTWYVDGRFLRFSSCNMIFVRLRGVCCWADEILCQYYCPLNVRFTHFEENGLHNLMPMIQILVQSEILKLQNWMSLTQVNGLVHRLFTQSAGCPQTKTYSNFDWCLLNTPPVNLGNTECLRHFYLVLIEMFEVRFHRMLRLELVDVVLIGNEQGECC